jgi:hypothetical protein
LDIAGAEKKLRQATFFVEHLRYVSRQPAGNPEHLEFYFSACLSAAKTVFNVLRTTGGTRFKTGERGWRGRTPPDEVARFEEMKKRRDKDVHFAKTSTEALATAVPVDFGMHIHLFGPSVDVELTRPDGTVVRGPVLQGATGLYIKQQGRTVDAAKACEEFIGHLGQLLEAMKAEAGSDDTAGESALAPEAGRGV